MKLQGKKIGILIESDFYEPEIFYYQHRFAEEGAEVHFLTRLWGQPSLTFSGHEHRVPFECRESLEGVTDEELGSYSAIIVPSGMVADRLRYTEDIYRLPPATVFLERAFANVNILKGIICHGMWLVAPRPELVRGRRVVAHNNLLGDVKNMGAVYVDEDVVVDGDLVTARTGGHHHLFARKIVDLLAAQSPDGAMSRVPTAVHHLGIAAKNPATVEEWYTRHFGFERVRVFIPGPDQIVYLKRDDIYLELFRATEASPAPLPTGAGPMYPGWRHLAFKVADVEAKLAEMGGDARITQGPDDYSAFIPGWKTAWVADPEGNIVEISQGYADA